jgi:streptomycin 3"-adenylyltransferase
VIPHEVAAQLERLTNGLRELLREDLVGVYAHGSLALGCFGPRSDVDVIAVSRRPTNGEERERLAALIEPPVEFHLLVERELETWRHPLPFDYYEGRRGVDHDLAAHLTIVRAAGIALHGPPPREVFPPVPADEYAGALRRDVDWCLEHFDKRATRSSRSRVPGRRS